MRGLIPAEATVGVYLCMGMGEPHHQREPKEAQGERWGEKVEIQQAAGQDPLPTLDLPPSTQAWADDSWLCPQYLPSRRPIPSVWAVGLPQAGLVLRCPPVSGNLLARHWALDSNRAESHPGSTTRELCDFEQSSDSLGSPISCL